LKMESIRNNRLHRKLRFSGFYWWNAYFKLI
jgi:hypothetical protein